MLEYINLGYAPGKDDLIAQYYLEPAQGISIEKAAEAIAGESSIGTWTDISTMNPYAAKKLKPNVFSINQKTGRIKIAYPAELFEPNNMPQIMSSIAGNIFGMKIIKNLRLEDISLPKSLATSFPGPAFGIEGVRQMTKTKNRPLLGTIIKPKVGLSPDRHAEVAYQAWTGGCDIVKDDENLSSMSFNNFQERVRKTLAMLKKAEQETGEKKIYLPNISAETMEMFRRANYVKQYGGTHIMIDILTVGWSGLQSIREADLGLAIHAHRAGHAAITRNPKHGISMLVIAKLARLAGADQLHIGTAVGKMEGTAQEVAEIEQEISNETISHGKSMQQRWHSIKPVFPVCSGGLYPGLVPELVKIMSPDIIIQMGGGIHGHPDGTIAGAKAARQAVDAALRKTSLKTYALNHAELKKALEKWG